MSKPLHLQVRFATLEARQQVIRTLLWHGVDRVMHVYHIRNRKRFLKFVARLIDNGEFMQVSPVGGLSGGPKHKMIMEHRETILDLAELLGETFVLENFNMDKNTLDGLKQRTPRQIYRKQTHADVADLKANTALKTSEYVEKKVMGLEMRVEGLAESNHQNYEAIRQLETLFHQFVEQTSNQISKALIMPLMQSLIRFEGELPERPDPLNVEGCLRQGHKYLGEKENKGGHSKTGRSN